MVAPLLIGILVTPFAVRAASVLAMSGPSALRLLYPYVALAHAHVEQFASSDETIAQWIMYGQFPVYGAVWMVIGRLTRGTGGALSALVLHCGGVAAAILTSNG